MADDQHSKDIKSLIACFNVIRDLSNRLHELELTCDGLRSDNEKLRQQLKEKSNG